jgi:hypothetical protein
MPETPVRPLLVTAKAKRLDGKVANLPDMTRTNSVIEEY